MAKGERIHKGKVWGGCGGWLFALAVLAGLAGSTIHVACAGGDVRSALAVDANEAAAAIAVLGASGRR